MLKGKSKVNTEIRREQITRAVFAIIARLGARGLTTAAIAKQVGVSEGNLYRHFQNKKEILSTAVDKIGEGLLENLKTVELADTDPPLLKLKRLFTLHLKYIEQNHGIPRLVFSEEMHMGNNELREKLLEAIGLYAKGVESLIREGQTNGTIRKKLDPAALSLTMIGMIQIITMKWSLTGFSFPLADEAMKLWLNFEQCLTTETMCQSSQDTKVRNST